MPHLTVAESTPQIAPDAKPTAPQIAPAAKPAALELVETPRCSLCSEPIGEGKGFAMVSPFVGQSVTVCRACHRAALGEGYRPQAQA